MKKLIVITGLLLLQSCLNPSEVQNKEQVVRSMGETVARQFSEISHLSIEDFQKLDRDRYVLVDVRSEPEVKISYIPSSVTKKKFEEDLQAYQGKKVILYSTLGPRSSKYALILKEKGLEVYNLMEGILGWAHRRLPLLDNEGKETLRVHIYTDAYDFTPQGYEGVYK